MGVLGRVLRALAPEVRRGGAGGGPLGTLGFGGISTGQMVNPRVAEGLAAVAACVQAISSALATLSPRVYKMTDDGRVDAPGHAVARICKRPNARQTWPDFIEMLVADTLRFGNGIAVIEYDGAGRVTALIPVPYQNCLISLLPDGRLAYDVIFYTAPWGGTGQPRRYFADEILHLKDRSEDSFLGRSRISRSPEMIEQSLQLQQYTGEIWRSGATPAGALKTPQTLSAEAAARLGESFAKSYGGVHNAKRTMVLEAGLEWVPFSISPSDAETLESRKYSTIEICRLFGVPPPIVQAYGENSFTSAQQAGLWFAQLTLLPWVRKIEAEFSRSVFSTESDHALELDVSTMMRADYASRWQSYAIARSADILSVSEIRQAEGYNPLPQQPLPPGEIVPGEPSQ